MVQTQHLSLLSIDDDPDQHMLLDRSLKQVTRFAIDIETVGDSEAARARIADRAHDVYLVDHRLTGSSGLELIEEAVASGNPGPFILLTGADDPGLDVRAIRAGAVDYLSKDATSPATLERSLLLAVERLRSIKAERAVGEALHRALVEKGEFLATIAHELRSPLTNVIGFAQILADPDLDVGMDERRDMLSRIIEESHEISSLVEDLLASARNEVGQLTAMRIPIDVDVEITQVLATLTPERRNRIRYRREGDVVAIGDPARLRQVVRNLTSNALKYGGPRIEVVARIDSDRAIIEVRDDGDGLPGGVDDVFGRHRPNLNVSGSNGIGLSLAMDLTRLMDGTIEYRRDEAWTVFAVDLPAAYRPSP
ncbi:MAG: response regulator [Acidimicrobiia bacterium]|nr:response regulator [Acidimicrobiia bacterium]